MPADQNAASSGPGGASPGSSFVADMFANAPPSRATAFVRASKPNKYPEHKTVGDHRTNPPPQASASSPNPPAPSLFRADAENRTIVKTGKSGAIRSQQLIYNADGHDAYRNDRTADVDYLTTFAEREQYKVKVARLMTRGGALFDTRQVNKDTSATGANVARFGGDASMPDLWKGAACIWVCAPDETDRAAFYSHVCIANKFHHSTFFGGGSVIGAGEWVVDGGLLMSVSANSGHYRTEMKQFYNSVLHMRNAFNAHTTVLLWDKGASKWEMVPYKTFITSPTGGGKYKISPHAA